MDVIQFFLSPLVAPFLAALTVVLVIFLMEVVLTVAAGSGFSDLVSALVGDSPLPDTSFTNWLLVREVPLLMAIVAFLGGFGLFGMALQGIAHHYFSSAVPGPIAHLLAIAFGVVSIRALALVFRKFALVSTTALKPAEFIGQSATLCSPRADAGYAGEASFTDQHGYTHHLMVEPAEKKEHFLKGDKLVILAQTSVSLFQAKKA